MSISTILLHLDGSERDAVRTAIAVRLAKQFKAHLVGLHVVMPYYPIAYGGPGAAGLADLQQQYTRAARAHADETRTAFEEATEREAVASEWRFEESDVAQTVAQHARYVDLTLLGQTPPDEPTLNLPEGLAAEVALESGGPVLTIPYTGEFPSLGERVVVAWNGAREASRAVRDALPFLRRAKSAIVLVIQPRDRDHIPGADIAAHLARHGVKVDTRQTTGDDVTAGDMLLSQAADLDADLIVMGAYGHSRLRELVLGGVTKHLLGSMTVPVLMSH